MELSALIAKVSEGVDLSSEEAEVAFHTVMSGQASPVQIAALLVGLRTKGHASSEVAGGVRALRRAMIPVVSKDPSRLVDTCGTGGGALTTFNVSTVAALVVAGAGVPVAKHGNRSFTSQSGSADVLEALGVHIQLTPEAMARVLDRAGIVFMFAPLLHPAMRHVGPIRRELGIPTIMNLLGPLTSPAGVKRQVVGVADGRLLPLVVEALRELGHARALVVHGAPGIDELSPLGPTLIAELKGGAVHTYEIEPGDAGLPPATAEEIKGGTPQENADLIEAILKGTAPSGAVSITLLNAAAGLWVAGLVDDLPGGVVLARESLNSGAAQQALEALREASGREAADAENDATGG